ncbi:bifunctional 3-(3-hydroxy-phenyl)propionate/3-hydroxycinnamic acid hydroxylase [Pseudomonas sp. CM25]|uniref:bifunctional 3-(3-hydroxy-phenyl)propionate/3-hydroxycinnamic acid hydroxylase MhpA n=1 Tax=Pseudomonas sp. CM25 TaxID=2738448 RepID=UPI001551E13D|nr:bifunctional 3-(3-hydroxy-phenyl)propionate/3-hydroxycinnamic acid hydroxylase [Pseudomonas sp. CM25]NQD55669.1 bifunctional 3-(3-hydroxy-phenyl)propionate/3-hydroxycinnamic acid hydroxylase [Pseudomonas sp. CM25]
MDVRDQTQGLYDVAIVGFGPAGAVAAAMLGDAGFKVWVADRLEEVYDIPRAIALDHEIMRIFQQIGIVDDVMPHTEPFTPSEYYGVDRQLIKRLTMIDRPYPLGYTPSIVFTQPPVERAIRRKVASLSNVTVELGVEVTSVDQDAEAATLSVIRGQGDPEQIRARYVLGCDGARSLVREEVGIVLEDLDFDEPWLVVDVLVNEAGLAKLPKTSVQYCDPQRPCTLVIGPGNHRRWEISLKQGEDPAQAATPERTWELLAPWLMPEDGELWRQASYRFHALVADRWRIGRVFIAGDAAHQQPPFLGQGMCQGLRDVANIAWKLSAVLKGEVEGGAGQVLLDSYGDERKRHVSELISRIKTIGSVICERDPAKARQRDAKLLAEADGVVRDSPRQDVLPKLVGGILSQTPHNAVGTIFPQPWMRQGDTRMRFDELVGEGWLLVVDPAIDVQRLPALNVHVIGANEVVEEESVLAQWMARHGCRAVLVRPDRYVFGAADNEVGLTRLLAEWQERIGKGVETSIAI